MILQKITATSFSIPKTSVKSKTPMAMPGLVIHPAGISSKYGSKAENDIYYAQLNAIYYGLDAKIELIEQDARQMKFEDHSFDAVLCADMIHHLEQPESVLTEMYRVCKSGAE